MCNIAPDGQPDVDLMPELVVGMAQRDLVRNWEQLTRALKK